MCVARVGKIVAVSGKKARVKFFDNSLIDGVDLSMVGAEEGAYVEVFANLALSRLDRKEVSERKQASLAIIGSRRVAFFEGETAGIRTDKLVLVT